jgi:hypothetical protein
MQSYEEFEALWERLDAELATEQARQRKFMEDLEKAIIEISIQHFPETEQYKHLFIEALTIKAHQRAVLLNEVLDLLVGGYSSDEFEFYNENHVPKRDVSEEEKQFLEETLKPMPPEQHAYFIQLNTERVTYEAQEREFVFLCYDKAKELIVKYFPEIVDFSGNALRNIDISAYYEMDEWTYDFYYYAGDYINETFLPNKQMYL